jgi:hypothetical protein
VSIILSQAQLDGLMSHALASKLLDPVEED